MNGNIRITNKRKNMGPKPEAGEAIVEGDRCNPVLGNRHILHNYRDPKERAQVIEAYRQDLEADWAAKGPMFREIHQLADRVAAGERIALRCWCAPYPCHLEHVVAKVHGILRETKPGHPLTQPPNAPNNPNTPQQQELI